ncbi:YciI family protein [Aggregicoccus sp. 17bor-14]|uniref:YciI family protein n=1 Tax=Myxococcaceae TaxID=31 RepID=UPI00129CC070|nr:MULTISPECIES: YciI family protein [Myxococcaceae]MBF5041535.1 YciI family protein [Simulacricoccus sp. 17bor-14]MRI87320.1 YciI family protein [Aggregicoccus sp. 17bor-14]
MRYLLSIYENEKRMETMPSGEGRQMMSAYRDFTESIKKSGNYTAGEALQPTATATTVRIRDGKRLVTDGPFAETKEQLGGFYLIEAQNLDEAVAIASRIPGALTGCIEIRPVVVFAPPQS